MKHNKQPQTKTRTKILRYLAIALLVILLLFTSMQLIGWHSIEACEQVMQDPRLKDITYNNPCRYDNTIYIQENGQYTPYLVFSSDYDGNLLLMRKELTEETVVYEDTNIFGAEGSYYPDSNVDKYLNETFINRFTSAMRNAILTSNVKIAALEEVNARDSFGEGRHKRKTESIPRKIFLLSAVELGIDSGIAMSAEEGQKIEGLNQFSQVEMHWLRSAYLWDDVHAWSYSMEYYGEWPISSPLPLRPVFTLPPDLKILEKNGILQDEPIFILEIDE